MSHGWMNRHYQHFCFNTALHCVAHPAVKQTLCRGSVQCIDSHSMHSHAFVQDAYMIMLSHGYEYRFTWTPSMWHGMPVICISLSILGKLRHAVSFIIGRDWCRISKFPVRLCLSYRLRQTNGTVTLSWFMRSCVPPRWVDDIWHRFHMLKLFPFDACTNTGSETTHSKCFDAISQQSVKQKTFVAFYTTRGKQCQHKRTRRSVHRSRVSLLMPLHPLCLGQAERGSNSHTNWVKDRGGMTEILVGAVLPLCSVVSEGHDHTKECMDFGGNL